ncbi:hypothetical protein GGH13_005433, partial [Coemansia sp. S155-1]
MSLLLSPMTCCSHPHLTCRRKPDHRVLGTREKMKSILREREMREKEERRLLCADLDRFMHRAPHDAGGSWSQETLYCTEPRFLLRHLPWFPGAVNPLCISAKSEEIVKYSSDRKTKPFFSPLLPRLKD